MSYTYRVLLALEGFLSAGDIARFFVRFNEYSRS